MIDLRRFGVGVAYVKRNKILSKRVKIVKKVLVTISVQTVVCGVILKFFIVKTVVFVEKAREINSSIARAVMLACQLDTKMSVKLPLQDHLLFLEMLHVPFA